MAADVIFVVGRAGAGKSRYLRQRAAALARLGARACYLVPEQFTFEAERALCQELGGLMDVAVFSFTSLAERVLRETGERRVFLTRQGRRMVIRKCAEEESNQLTAFNRVYDRPGFSGACDDFFTLCKRFDILPEQLEGAVTGLPEHAPFRAKLEDLSRIYRAYEAHLCERQMDAEDAFFALCKRLPDSFVSGAEVLIDGFDLISEQLFDIIAALMDVSPRLTIALRLDLSPRCRDARVFAGEERVHARIKKIAAQKGKSIEYVYLPEEDAREGGEPQKEPALVHLEREGFAYPFTPFAGASNGALRLFAGTDVRAEAEAAADAVLLAADGGLRFREMAIIATDMDKYIGPVSRALQKRGIPFFTDAKHPLSGYAAAQLVLSCLRAAAHGLPAGELISIAKSGFAGVSRTDAEEFENYVVGKNARGSLFQRPFRDASEGAERARQVLTEPLLALRAGLSASRTAAGKAAALYDYMESLSLRDQLLTLTSALRQSGRLEWMEENAQVYNMLLELISQLHAILGEARISTARFIDIFEEGISAYEVGVIPTSADQLLLGSLGRSRARELEALYVLGASQGMFPAPVQDDGMVSDAEIATLAGLGLPELPDTGKRGDKELADVYGAAAKPRKLLYLSYSLSGADGAPCALAERIRALFPDVAIETDVSPLPPATPESALRRVAAALRSGVDAGELPTDAASLYAALAARPQQEGWRERLAVIERALFYGASPEPFGQEIARALYGATPRGSASRLEAFNQCPFRHFARYGLRLEPRREYRERSADEGVFCHDALCAFTKALMELGKPIPLVAEEEIDAMLSRLLPELAAAHNGGILLDTARNRALFARLSRKIAATAKAIVRQLAAGDFRVAGSEVPFGPNQALPALTLELPSGTTYALSGQIDRVDGCQSEAGEAFVRVIDYKTGSAAFAMEDLFFGLKLQLPLYLSAITAASRVEEKAARAAGMYFLPVIDPVSDEEDEESLLKALDEQFRMRGLTLRDPTLMRLGGAGVAFSARPGKYAVDGESLALASRFAREKAASTAQAIYEGRAEALPYRKKNGRTPCGSCDFKTLCGFDAQFPGCAYRSVPPLGPDAFFKEVGAHGQVDE